MEELVHSQERRIDNFITSTTEYIHENTKDWIYVVKDFTIKLFGQAIIPLIMDLFKKHIYGQALAKLNPDA